MARTRTVLVVAGVLGLAALAGCGGGSDDDGGGDASGGEGDVVSFADGCPFTTEELSEVLGTEVAELPEPEDAPVVPICGFSTNDAAADPENLAVTDLVVSVAELPDGSPSVAEIGADIENGAPEGYQAAPELGPDGFVHLTQLEGGVEGDDVILFADIYVDQDGQGYTVQVKDQMTAEERDARVDGLIQVLTG